MDKLQLSFTTKYTSNHFKNLCKYDNNEELKYELDKYITFQKINGNRIEYNNSYLIVVSGLSFGTFNIHHKLAQTHVNIDITNQFLYVHSGNDIVSNIFKISNSLNLNFANISRYELARDSIKDYYNINGATFTNRSVIH